MGAFSLVVNLLDVITLVIQEEKESTFPTRNLYGTTDVYFSYHRKAFVGNYPELDMVNQSDFYQR